MPPQSGRAPARGGGKGKKTAPNATAWAGLPSPPPNSEARSSDDTRPSRGNTSRAHLNKRRPDLAPEEHTATAASSSSQDVRVPQPPADSPPRNPPRQQLLQNAWAPEELVRSLERAGLGPGTVMVVHREPDGTISPKNIPPGGPDLRSVRIAQTQQRMGLIRERNGYNRQQLTDAYRMIFTQDVEDLYQHKDEVYRNQDDRTHPVTSCSRFMSYIARHGFGDRGVTVDSRGWFDLSLYTNEVWEARNHTPDVFAAAVVLNPKSRFQVCAVFTAPVKWSWNGALPSLDNVELYWRAEQGHQRIGDLDVTMMAQEISLENWDSFPHLHHLQPLHCSDPYRSRGILHEGYLIPGGHERQGRAGLHWAGLYPADMMAHQISGAHASKPIWWFLDLNAAIRAGVTFSLTLNNVFLNKDKVSIKYCKAVDMTTGRYFHTGRQGLPLSDVHQNIFDRHQCFMRKMPRVNWPSPHPDLVERPTNRDQNILAVEAAANLRSSARRYEDAGEVRAPKEKETDDCIICVEPITEQESRFQCPGCTWNSMHLSCFSIWRNTERNKALVRCPYNQHPLIEDTGMHRAAVTLVPPRHLTGTQATSSNSAWDNAYSSGAFERVRSAVPMPTPPSAAPSLRNAESRVNWAPRRHVRFAEGPQPPTGSFEDDDSSPDEEEESSEEEASGARTGDPALTELGRPKQRAYQGIEENLLQWINRSTCLYEHDVSMERKDETLQQLQLSLRLMQESIERIDIPHEEQNAMVLWAEMTQETRNLARDTIQGYKGVREAEEIERQRLQQLRSRPAPPPIPTRAPAEDSESTTLVGNRWKRTRGDTALPTPAPLRTRGKQRLVNRRITRPPLPPVPEGEDKVLQGLPPSSPITPPAEGQTHQASLRSETEPEQMEVEEDDVQMVPSTHPLPGDEEPSFQESTKRQMYTQLKTMLSEAMRQQSENQQGMVKTEGAWERQGSYIWDMKREFPWQADPAEETPLVWLTGSAPFHFVAEMHLKECFPVGPKRKTNYPCTLKGEYEGEECKTRSEYVVDLLIQTDDLSHDDHVGPKILEELFEELVDSNVYRHHLEENGGVLLRDVHIMPNANKSFWSIEQFIATFEHDLPNTKCREVLVLHRTADFMHKQGIRPDLSPEVVALSNSAKSSVTTEFDKNIAIQRLRNILPADTFEGMKREMTQIAHELYKEHKQEGRPETSMVIFSSFDELEHLCYDVSTRTPDLKLLASLNSDDVILGTGPPSRLRASLAERFSNTISEINWRRLMTICIAERACMIDGSEPRDTSNMGLPFPRQSRIPWLVRDDEDGTKKVSQEAPKFIHTVFTDMAEGDKLMADILKGEYVCQTADLAGRATIFTTFLHCWLTTVAMNTVASLREQADLPPLAIGAKHWSKWFSGSVIHDHISSGDGDNVDLLAPDADCRYHYQLVSQIAFRAFEMRRFDVLDLIAVRWTMWRYCNEFVSGPIHKMSPLGPTVSPDRTTMPATPRGDFEEYPQYDASQFTFALYRELADSDTWAPNEPEGGARLTPRHVPLSDRPLADRLPVTKGTTVRLYDGGTAFVRRIVRDRAQGTEFTEMPLSDEVAAYIQRDVRYAANLPKLTDSDIITMVYSRDDNLWSFLKEIGRDACEVFMRRVRRATSVQMLRDVEQIIDDLTTDLFKDHLKKKERQILTDESRRTEFEQRGRASKAVGYIRRVKSSYCDSINNAITSMSGRWLNQDPRVDRKFAEFMLTHSSVFTLINEAFIERPENIVLRETLLKGFNEEKNHRLFSTEAGNAIILHHTTIINHYSEGLVLDQLETRVIPAIQGVTSMELEIVQLRLPMARSEDPASTADAAQVISDDDPDGPDWDPPAEEPSIPIEIFGKNVVTFAFFKIGDEYVAPSACNSEDEKWLLSKTEELMACCIEKKVDFIAGDAKSLLYNRVFEGTQAELSNFRKYWKEEEAVKDSILEFALQRAVAAHNTVQPEVNDDESFTANKIGFSLHDSTLLTARDATYDSKGEIQAPYSFETAEHHVNMPLEQTHCDFEQRSQVLIIMHNGTSRHCEQARLQTGLELTKCVDKNQHFVPNRAHYSCPAHFEHYGDAGTLRRRENHREFAVTAMPSLRSSNNVSDEVLHQRRLRLYPVDYSVKKVHALLKFGPENFFVPNDSALFRYLVTRRITGIDAKNVRDRSDLAEGMRTTDAEIAVGQRRQAAAAKKAAKRARQQTDAERQANNTAAMADSDYFTSDPAATSSAQHEEPPDPHPFRHVEGYNSETLGIEGDISQKGKGKGKQGRKGKKRKRQEESDWQMARTMQDAEDAWAWTDTPHTTDWAPIDDRPSRRFWMGSARGWSLSPNPDPTVGRGWW